MKLNRSSYDLSWLLRQPRTLERDHVAEVLRASVAHEYPATEPEATAALRADLVKAKEEIVRLQKRLEEAHAPECSGCGAPVETFTVVCVACSR